MLPIGLLLFAAHTAPGFFGARVEPFTGQVRIYEASAEQPLEVDLENDDATAEAN